MKDDVIHVNDVPISRRRLLNQLGMGFGGVALAHLMAPNASEAKLALPGKHGGILDAPHFAPKAKRAIYLFQSGGPSQADLFDYKPLLNEMNGQDLPESVRKGQRLTTMSAHQAILPLAGSIFPFQRHGNSGAWVSDRLPQMAKIVDPSNGGLGQGHT